MTKSIKPWDKVGNVPRKFALSSVGVGETECVSSVTVNVVLVHSAPNDVRISLTREGKQSALPRATNMSTTVLLKDFGSTAPFPHHGLPPTLPDRVFFFFFFFSLLCWLMGVFDFGGRCSRRHHATTIHGEHGARPEFAGGPARAGRLASQRGTQG
jgi:hypothetical protein